MLNQNAVASAAIEGGKSKMPRLSRILGYILDTVLYLGIVLVPLFFLPITLDVIELNKQTLLVILSLIGVVVWLGKALVDGRFVLARSWLHLIVVLFASGWLITSLFSKDLYISLVGNLGQMQWSFATILGFVVFYFLVVNRVGTTRDFYRFILAFLVSSSLVGLYGFLQLMGVYLLAPLADFTKLGTFNTIGTINSFGVYMIIPLVVATSLTVFGCKDGGCILGKKAKSNIIENAIVWFSLGISLLVAIVVDFWVIWAGILFGLSLLVLISLIRSVKIKHPVRIAVPVILATVAVLLLVFRTPINLGLPAEVSPTASASWSIAKNVLRDSPVFGSGPGTWLYDYAKYRSPMVNLSRFWTVRFERGFSAFYTLIAMTGIVGISLWLILVFSAIIKSANHLIKEKDDDEWQAYLTVFASWLTLVFVAFIYNYNFAHHFVFWFLLALLGAMITKKGFIWDAKKSTLTSSVISITFVVLSVASLSIIWLFTQRLVADAAYSKAVISFRQTKDIDSVIDSLNNAVSWNKFNDIYYRNLSQAYLLKAGKEYSQAQKDMQAEIKKARDEKKDLKNKDLQKKLNDEYKSKINKVNQIVAAAVDVAKKATQMNPVNVDNWENLAIVYQNVISILPGADKATIKAFQDALKYEPNNPVYSTEIGKIYIANADQERALAQKAKKDEDKKDLENKAKINLDLAAEFFNRAIQAKPDYAPAHYHLGLVYDRQGRVQDAVKKLSQVLVGSQDVGVAFQLALLEYRNKEPNKAISLLAQIIQKYPKYVNARWYLSIFLEKAGKYEDALKQVEAIDKLVPKNKNIQKRISDLQQLIKKNPATSIVKSDEKLPAPVKETITGPKGANEIKK